METNSKWEFGISSLTVNRAFREENPSHYNLYNLIKSLFFSDVVQILNLRMGAEIDLPVQNVEETGKRNRF